MSFFQHLITHNSAETVWLAVALGGGLFLLLLMLRRLIRSRLAARARESSYRLYALVVELLAATRGWMLAAVSVLVAGMNLDLPDNLETLLSRVVMALLFLQCGLWGNGAVRAWLGRRQQEQRDRGDGDSITSMALLGFITRLALWSVVLILVLDQLGFNVTALVASLGIGGVAVALAVQNILGDLFASLSIALDKPFVVGDFIIVGDVLGTVEYVGLKTTRIRSLSGEQVVMSNADLLGSRIRNYKRMQERRIVFGFGIGHDTPADKVARLPQVLRQIVESQDEVRFDRAHFQGFGAAALNFEVVYYVLVADFNRYMDVQQAINLELLRHLNTEGITVSLPASRMQLVEGAAASAGAGAAAAALAQPSRP